MTLSHYRRSGVPSRPRQLAAAFLAASLAAGASFAQTPDPAGDPGFAEPVPVEATPTPEEQFISKAILLDGSIALTEGARSPRWNVREENAGTEIYFEGDIHGPEARLTLRVWASGGSVGDYSVTVRSTAGEGASSPFSVPIRVHGMVEAVEIGNDLGDPVTLRHLEIRGAYLPAPQAFTPGPEPVRPLAPTPGPTPPPTASRVGPPPSDPPSYPNYPPYANPNPTPYPTPYATPAPTPYPRAVSAAPERVVLYTGELKIREGDKSRWWDLDPTRTVSMVELTWSNSFFGSAKGKIFVNGQNASTYAEKPVGGQRTDSYKVDGPLRSIAVGSTGGTLKLRRLTIVYEGEAAPAPRPRLNDSPPGDDVLEFRDFTVRENDAYPIELPGRVFVRQVEVMWRDRAKGAVGHVTTDLEPLMGSPGKRVSGGDSDRAVFPIGRAASRLKLHARHADIEVVWLRVHIAKE